MGACNGPVWRQWNAADLANMSPREESDRRARRIAADAQRRVSSDEAFVLGTAIGGPLMGIAANELFGDY